MTLDELAQVVYDAAFADSSNVTKNIACAVVLALRDDLRLAIIGRHEPRSDCPACEAVQRVLFLVREAESYRSLSTGGDS